MSRACSEEEQAVTMDSGRQQFPRVFQHLQSPELVFVIRTDRLSIAINFTVNFDLHFSLVFSRLRSHGGRAWGTIM